MDDAVSSLDDSISTEVVKSKEVFIVAGEASGDLYGSRLIEAAQEESVPMNFVGVGGSRMRSAGCSIVVPAEEISVMGAVEVIGKLRVIRCALQTIEEQFKRSRPALVVLIDFADFNMRVAKLAKKHSIPVLYYISPKVWVWRAGRAKKIAELVDRIAVIFPFEVDCYAPYNVPVDYVGHPLLDEPMITERRREFLSKLHLPLSKKYVGLFPGSRWSEIKYSYETILETAQTLHQLNSDISFIVPVASTLNLQKLKNRAESFDLPITFIADESVYNIAAACDAVLAVSGTVTLQVALAGIPMAIFYKVSPISYRIGKMLVKTPFVGLPNIVAGREIVKEYIQGEANAAHLATEITRVLEDRAYQEEMKVNLLNLKKSLGTGGAAKRVLAIMKELAGVDNEY